MIFEAGECLFCVQIDIIRRKQEKNLRHNVEKRNANLPMVWKNWRKCNFDKKITCQTGKFNVLYSMDMKDITLVSCKNI